MAASVASLAALAAGDGPEARTATCAKSAVKTATRAIDLERNDFTRSAPGKGWQAELITSVLNKVLKSTFSTCNTY